MFFFIFPSYNIFHWIHLLHRISVVLSGVTYCLFSRFYLMFVMVFTACIGGAVGSITVRATWLR